MNHFKCVSNRVSWYELKRLQSSLSVANSKIQIPARIKRSSTDVLSAIEATIPDAPQLGYAYQDDPFLHPIKKKDYRLYLLSYEAGKKTAMWIYNDHRDLFPKHLSEPEVEAFKPPEKYTDKSQVSEEILLNLVSRQRLSDAIHVYQLLEGQVSNDAKQMLLELLCFSEINEIRLLNEISFEQWFHDEKNSRYTWQENEHRNELYNFLIKQGAATEAAARNVMICGLARFSRNTEAWALYERCKENNIPFNITTYNCILRLMSVIFRKNEPKKIPLILDILKSMNEKGLKPNLQTLNAALKVVAVLPRQKANDIVQFLIAEFKRIGVKCSLASYYYMLLAVDSNDVDSCDYFDVILNKVNIESYKLEDPDDGKFFYHAMFLARLQLKRKAGDKIHEIFLTGDNYKLLTNSKMLNNYFTSYLMLVQLTSAVTEFFKAYNRYVPTLCTPTKREYQYMIDNLKLQEPATVVKYIMKLWRDINALKYSDLSLRLNLIRLMKIDFLPANSPLKAEFANAAWSCWTNIKQSQADQETYTPIHNSVVASLAITLLHVERVKEAEEILAIITKGLDLFLPTISKLQLDALFTACLSKRSIAGALSVLEYSVQAGFPHVNEMARKLNNQSAFTSDDHDKLINLVGVEALRAPNASESS